MTKRLRLAGAAVAILLLVALFGPLIASHGPVDQNLERRLEGPTRAHPFGLDELGRDILSRLLWGARVSMLVGFTVVGSATLLGLFLGALAGTLGGRVDALLMRLLDVFLAFPGILLAIALVAVLGPALSHVILALVAIGWVGTARLVRGQILQLKEQEFVLAARAGGVSFARLVLR
ncbi:MAG: ABC transporter permease, partial [Thermoanaerobaculia bacterium]|nr:ABC transporter permease [Thermoanaerobaculia bacterium]